MARNAARLLALLGAALTLGPGLASARTRTLAPPGNSAISQYVEVVPTASDGRPAATIHPAGGPRSGGPGTGQSGPLSRRATAQLDARGQAGRGVASLVRSTAPAGPGSGRPQALTSGGGSPVGSVLRALTGSSSSGGLGVLLPLILAASFLGAGAVALLRRRRST